MPEFTPDYTQIIPKSTLFKADPNEDFQGCRCTKIGNNLELPDIVRPPPTRPNRSGLDVTAYIPRAKITAIRPSINELPIFRQMPAKIIKRGIIKPGFMDDNTV
ncbi:MAG: hypothetical protein WCK53_14790 [Methanomicrobiales archaeon]